MSEVYERLLEETQGTTFVRSAIFVFDEQEAKGDIVVERGAYGLYIWVDGECLALIDLFYLSPANDNEEPHKKHPAIHLYQPGEDDALGSVHWYPDRTEIMMERIGVDSVTGAYESRMIYRPKEE